MSDFMFLPSVGPRKLFSIRLLTAIPVISHFVRPLLSVVSAHFRAKNCASVKTSANLCELLLTFPYTFLTSANISESTVRTSDSIFANRWKVTVEC
jgi:hypothetical protein